MEIRCLVACFALVLLPAPALADPADAQLESNEADAEFGWAAASAGDVNGDGYDDVIVGAPSYDRHLLDDAGAAFVFHGSAAGIASGGPSSAAAHLFSNQSESGFGAWVAGVGDVNHDGYDDVAVGASRYETATIPTEGGAVFIYHGSATGIASGSPAVADTRLASTQYGAEYGQVAGAGDVNGDGYDDLLVGARLYDAGQEDEGAAFLHLGGPTGILGGGPGSASARFEGDAAGAAFSFHAAGAGDVNADGFDDFIISGGGVAFLYLGHTGPITNGTPTTASAQLDVDQSGAGWGTGAAIVGAAGDVDADGYGDVFASAPYYDFDQVDEGAVFVWHGSPAGIASGDETSAASALEGDESLSLFGVGVDGAGDVNDDGYDDLLVSAPWQSDVAPQAGASWIHLGGPAGITSGGRGTAFRRLGPDQVSASFGYEAAGAGDVNGDGAGDGILGAYFFQAGQSFEGAAFLFLGDPPAPVVPALPVLGSVLLAGMLAWAGRRALRAVSLD